ncbi:MAG: hypothetical protein AAFO89_04420 [Planctomycetota bacterium]
MKTVFVLASACAIAAPSAASTTAVFTDLASFQAVLDGPFLSEDFSGNTFAGTEDFFSGNGFSATASTIDSEVDGDGINDGLFNDVGLLSTANATDALVLTFSANTTAIGGDFISTDIDFFPSDATVTVTLGDGTVENLGAFGGFVGFVNLSGITSVTIDALGTDSFGLPAFAAAESLIVGAAIPAPASAALLGLGGLAAARRRR